MPIAWGGDPAARREQLQGRRAHRPSQTDRLKLLVLVKTWSETPNATPASHLISSFAQQLTHLYNPREKKP